ncbi:hypothetical protein [Burkholderia ubonensis]|uniref:hypothetical protein n=1 Tax=Burkholderia ubonensis TaxID=101571 RepID=UPI001C8A4289|nr:hypothetical protein [Burkholderia ubonensis]
MVAIASTMTCAPTHHEWRKRMLKAKAGNTIFLGLSKRNVELLKEGKPIAFDASAIGIDGHTIVIMYGETELAIRDELIRAARGAQ